MRPERATTRLYDRSYDELSQKERWPIMLHGLRGTPLDQRIWGTRHIERTKNRQLIPIRTFYLRASEDQAFRIQRLQITFEFKETSAAEIASAPEKADPIVDIAFGAAYRAGIAGSNARVDREYFLRISASPETPSGLFYRSHLKQIQVASLKQSVFETGKQLTFELLFESNSLRVVQDGVSILSYQNSELNRGMVGLTGGWVPAFIGSLLIEAQHLPDTSIKKYSGHILIPRKKTPS